MKRPNLLTGIGFAFAAAVLTVPAWWGLLETLSYWWAFRLTLILPYLLYCAYLLAAARKRIGNLTLAAGNLAIAFGLLTLPAGNSVFATILVSLVTLNRSLLFHRSMVSIACDGVVSAAGLAFAGYLFNTTGSLPAALWAFFLVQSVFVLIPPHFSEKRGLFANGGDDPVEPFQRSRRQAQATLQRLVENQP